MANTKHQTLCDLARLKSDRALSALATEIGKRSEILAQIDALAEQLRTAQNYATQDISFGANLSAIETLTRNRTAQLRIAQRHVETKIEALKANAAKEFGRVTVLEKILNI